MEYVWDWTIFFQPSVTGEGTYWHLLLQGLGWTLVLSLLTWTLALFLAAVVGVARTMPTAWARIPATIFVDVFRNIPLIVQLFLWYFVVPEILPASIGDVLKRRCQLNSLAPRKWPVLERQMLAAPFQASKASIR